jgi:hypothetical protein
MMIWGANMQFVINTTAVFVVMLMSFQLTLFSDPAVVSPQDTPNRRNKQASQHNNTALLLCREGFLRQQGSESSGVT